MQIVLVFIQCLAVALFFMGVTGALGYAFGRLGLDPWLAASASLVPIAVAIALLVN